jgi:predicted transcriptional regulator
LTFDEIARRLNAKTLCGEEKLAAVEVEHAYACDLMSDVLAFCSPGALLITGLTNIQIVRTAQMLDIPGVLFVRGKAPQQETIDLAREAGIPLVLTTMNMFHACGELYASGIAPDKRGEAAE